MQADVLAAFMSSKEGGTLLIGGADDGSIHGSCRGQVDPSALPVDAKVICQKTDKPEETRTEFFVRVADGTKALDVVQRERYVAGRWGAGS